MSETTALIAELENSLKSGSSAQRVETLRRVTDLFLNDADRLNEQQIQVFDDVLVHLIQRIENKALAQLSTSLAPIDKAPIQLIRQFANNDEIAIAGPVLTHSSRLTQDDLISVAKSKSQGHLLAISTRSSLNEAVTDVLVEHGDKEVAHQLARNSGARFSETGFATLVKNAETDASLAEKLGLRLDIPIRLLRELLRRATEAVRSRLLATAPAEAREEIQRALAEIANEVGWEATGPRNFSPAQALVQEINRNGKLSDSIVIEFAKARQYEEMVVALSLLCSASIETIEDLVRNIRSDGLVVACKAGGLKWAAVHAILSNRFAHHSISDDELANAKSAFLTLSQPSAQRTLRFWQARGAAKKTA